MAKDDKPQKARALESLLMDAMHAMTSMDQVEALGLTLPKQDADAAATKAGGRSDDDSLVDRITDLTGSALRLAARSTSTSLRVGRALMKSQDQIRVMLATGQSLRDIREVAGLTLSEMSDALNLRDKSLLEAVENGTSTLSFELILRLAALVARNDPIPFILKYTRTYNPEAWQILNDWGVGKLPLQFERERQFINIFRSHDDARELSDEGFEKVLAFTRESFEMSLHFVAEQEQAVAEMKARYEGGDKAARGTDKNKGPA
ncbi:MAG: XRE family transcriptional regulator [Marinobacter sp.]|uniref:helix-turn-helix domain-containing protein n=1 Tax=Marinobacter sp. TaxID=50741 RepID=UPI00299EAF93|nr:XRE family transcriptional regulator [Marinobacter sp.]MDX1634844.1 XRE family transcriptional regulator [Marinobacter sp.]